MTGPCTAELSCTCWTNNTITMRVDPEWMQSAALVVVDIWQVLLMTYSACTVSHSVRHLSAMTSLTGLWLELIDWNCTPCCCGLRSTVQYFSRPNSRLLHNSATATACLIFSCMLSLWLSVNANIANRIGYHRHTWRSRFVTNMGLLCSDSTDDSDETNDNAGAEFARHEHTGNIKLDTASCKKTTVRT